ncbi:MAG: hypothetical protein ACRYFX_16175 [Janthinobacterium lividum]
MRFRPSVLFQRAAHYGGVRRVNVYALRLLYALMFFMLGQTTWAHILAHRGAREPDNAMAWSVWAAFATLAGLGIFRPLQMLPILLLEVFYKVLWLVLVAYPLWAKGALAGSPAAYQAGVFAGAIVVIVLVPWGYVVTNYVYRPQPKNLPSVVKTEVKV